MPANSIAVRWLVQILLRYEKSLSFHYLDDEMNFDEMIGYEMNFGEMTGGEMISDEMIGSSTWSRRKKFNFFIYLLLEYAPYNLACIL